MRLTRRGRVLVALVIVLGALTISGYVYLRSLGVVGASDPGARVELMIPKGATATDVAELLEDKGVIASALGFRIALYLSGEEIEIEAGRYELYRGLSAADAVDAVAEGALGEEFVTVTFPEGSWLTDFASILEQETHVSGEAFLDLVTNGGVRSRLAPPDVTTLEGLLFPSTYQVIDKDSARSVAQRLVREMEEQTAALDCAAKMEAIGYTAYEGVIIASMIEGEAKIEEERAKVARVVYNRLQQGIALGIDATVLYAIGEHKEILTESDLAVDSPYNTRKYPGLPPTPIGAPGATALEAAANPAAGDWLYYVLSDCEGHHFFTSDYDEFINAKNAYQAREC